MLSKEYINSGEHLELQCPKGHLYLCSWDNFKQGHRCQKCINADITASQKLPFNYVKSFIESKGFILISNKYINISSNLILKCKHGHIFKKSFADFKIGKSICPECAKTEYIFNRTLTLVKERNYEFIQWIGEIKTKNTELIVKCTKGHIHKIRFIEFNRQRYLCPICKKLSLKEKGKKVIDKMIDKGFVPLFKADHYRNNTQKLPYICLNHIEKGIQYCISANLSKLKYGCMLCGSEYRSGENSHAWKGGISNLTDFMRNQIVQWKKDSMKECKYKCILSNEPFQIIHHLYPFNKIVQECLAVLNLDVRTEMSMYTHEEQDSLSKTCLDLHYLYGFGVCLTDKIHKLFHTLYGNDAYENDFYEFRKRYELGEFKEIL